MGRIQELDGLRAIAILLVLAAHFVPHDSRLANVLGLGWCGVDLFFAISGFLITGILLRLREQEAPFRTFYWRRTLRIFPPYYLVLTLILLSAFLHAEHVNHREVVRHALFLSSATPGLLKLALARLALHGTAPLPQGPRQFEYSLLQFKDCFGIYWSLSVEELFYLAWAPIVLKGSRRLILISSVAPLVVCPLLRGLAHTTPHIDESIGFVFRFDSLTAGGCVALLFWGVGHGFINKRSAARGLIATIIFAGTCLLGLIEICGISRGVDVRTTLNFSLWGFSLLAILCASVVGVCALWSGAFGALPSILRSKRAAHLGNVSYMMYLIHLPTYVVIQLVFVKLLGRNSLATSTGLEALCSILAIAGTIGLASLSWIYFEGPIMRMKDSAFPIHGSGRELSGPTSIDQPDRVCA